MTQIISKSLERASSRTLQEAIEIGKSLARNAEQLAGSTIKILESELAKLNPPIRDEGQFFATVIKAADSESARSSLSATNVTQFHEATNDFSPKSPNLNPPIQQPTKIKRGPIILIADDDNGPVEALTILIGDMAQLLVARNGREAIAIIETNDIDLAVLDIRMRGSSGIEVLRQLKQKCPNAEAIMLTGFATSQDMLEALRLRALDWFEKPYDSKVVRKRIMQVLEMKGFHQKPD